MSDLCVNMGQTPTITHESEVSRIETKMGVEPSHVVNSTTERMTGSGEQQKAKSSVFQGTWGKDADGNWMLYCDACSGSYSTQNEEALRKHQDERCPALHCFKCPGSDGRDIPFGFIGSLQRHVDAGHPKEGHVS